MATAGRKTSVVKAPQKTGEMTDAELREAVTQMLVREKEDKERREVERKREEEAAIARKAQETEAAMNRMARSIETIKYCVLSISTVMVLSIVIGIVVLMEVEREVERIKGEVAAIEREAERIYEKLANPFQSLGASFDRELKESLGLLMSPPAQSVKPEQEK